MFLEDFFYHFFSASFDFLFFERFLCRKQNICFSLTMDSENKDLFFSSGFSFLPMHHNEAICNINMQQLC